MARPIWNGSISFGLVSIPVKLYSATSRKTVRFNQIDADGRQPGSAQKRVSDADGTEVPAYGNIAKGYELASGQYVVVSDDELAALDPEASRTIDLLEFVDLASIDPIYYDSGLPTSAPDEATAKPYALLLQAMEAARWASPGS
jgi:DNA end-binding protein Ku